MELVSCATVRLRSLPSSLLDGVVSSRPALASSSAAVCAAERPFPGGRVVMKLPSAPPPYSGLKVNGTRPEPAMLTESETGRSPYS